jgi:hypothetical protein
VFDTLILRFKNPPPACCAKIGKKDFFCKRIFRVKNEELPNNFPYIPALISFLTYFAKVLGGDPENSF